LTDSIRTSAYIGGSAGNAREDAGDEYLSGEGPSPGEMTDVPLHLQDPRFLGYVILLKKLGLLEIFIGNIPRCSSP
jgi:hypothetical protein